MNKEKKELLIKDLSARLLYKVICTDSRHGDSIITEIDIIDETVYCDDFDEYVGLEHCKPYLRPMSSMTEEERSELRKFCRKEEGILYDIGISGVINAPAIIDYLNARHFDFRGLIPMGLALAAPEGMYKTK